MSNTLKITSGPIIKPLLMFFFPILFGTFFQQLYNTVDALIVGNFLGKEALAAVGGITGTYVNLYVGFIVGLASGATVLISQYFGMNDYRDVSKTVHTGMALSIYVGLGFSIFGILTSRLALTFLNVPPEIMEMSLIYTNIYFAGLIPLLLYNMGCSIFRAVGDSKHPLYYLIAASVVNTVLDIVFISVFNMGVAGAALATVIAEIVSALLCVLALMNSKDALHLELKEIRADKDIALHIIKIGFPAGIQSVLYSISNLVIGSAINSYGVDTIAANTAWGKIDSIYWQTVGALGIAITTFVGQNYGAKEFARVKKGNNRWLLTSLGISALISIVVCAFAPTLIGIFNSDPGVIEVGSVIVFAVAPFWIFYTPVEIIAGTLRGMGNTLIPTIITACGIVGVRLTWVLLVASGQSLKILLSAYPISWGITALVFIFYYYFYYARKLKVN